MEKFILAVALALFALISDGASAQSLPKVMGVVMKIDDSAEKMTIKHDPIPNLDMSEMTMVFKVADKGFISQVKKGDKIQFTADRVNGQLTVTSITKLK